MKVGDSDQTLKVNSWIVGNIASQQLHETGTKKATKKKPIEKRRQK